MSIDQQPILDQIDRALHVWREMRATSKHDDCSDLPSDKTTQACTLIGATIERLAPPGSLYARQARHILGKRGVTRSTLLPHLAGILGTLRSDYEGHYLQAVHELIHADLFADFLDMAEHLLGEGYKDPAAVMAGGVLEEHLRKLCEKFTISITSGGRPKKADRLNADLARAKVYSKLDQKSVTAWLDLRNKAAHGKYDEYTGDQVALMISGIRDFLSRNPA